MDLLLSLYCGVRLHEIFQLQNPHEIEIRAGGCMRSGSGPDGPVRRTARRFTQASRIVAGSERRNDNFTVVKPQPPPLGDSLGCSLRAGLAPSDPAAFTALSHVKLQSFNVLLIRLAGKRRSDRYCAST